MILQDQGKGHPVEGRGHLSKTLQDEWGLGRYEEGEAGPEVGIRCSKEVPRSRSEYFASENRENKVTELARSHRALWA